MIEWLNDILVGSLWARIRYWSWEKYLNIFPLNRIAFLHVTVKTFYNIPAQLRKDSTSKGTKIIDRRYWMKCSKAFQFKIKWKMETIKENYEIKWSGEVRTGTYSTQALGDKRKKNMWEVDFSKSFLKRWDSMQTLWEMLFILWDIYFKIAFLMMHKYMWSYFVISNNNAVY